MKGKCEGNFIPMLSTIDYKLSVRNIEKFLQKDDDIGGKMVLKCV
jgi:hypothetical protein